MIKLLSDVALRFNLRRFYTGYRRDKHASYEQFAAQQAGANHNRPISVYRPGEMPIQSCGQSVSARRGKRYTETGLSRELLVRTPSTLRNLGFQCASAGSRDSPAEPTDHFQDLELFNPQNWTT
jgi:hypothetical protein